MENRYRFQGVGAFILFAVIISSSLFGQQVDWDTIQKSRAMTAVYFEGEIVLDGVLDDEAWKLAKPSIGEFIQKFPEPGALATEQTDIRILYNDEMLYIGADCWDSAGPDGIIINDITKDFFTTQSDGLQVILDTFNDDRNGFLFASNPAEGRFDMQCNKNGDAGNVPWDGIWYNRATIDETGWHVEFGIPFKTLRFTKNEIQEWGINFERRIRRKYEETYWSPMPLPYRLGRVSAAGKLEGLKGLKQGKNMYIKPYLSTPAIRIQGNDWDFKPEVGIEVFKWSVTPQLTLDGTINTDFSQVEVDNLQTNLTRFSLFFPEKRDFFLENAGVFSWGHKYNTGSVPDLMPFFSRRIGLTSEGEIVPLLGGARLTGRAGKFSVGIMSMQTDELWTAREYDSRGELTEDSEFVPTTNYSVIRVKRDIFSRSEIGGIFTNKEVEGPEFNRTYGVDGSFNFFRYLDINAYLLQTESEENTDEDWAGSAHVSWNDGFWVARAGEVRIGEEFNPELGFVPRTGMYKSFGTFGITPRPKNSFIRELNPAVDFGYITNIDGDLESRNLDLNLKTTFDDGSTAIIGWEQNFERLYDNAFQIRNDITIPLGDYEWDTWQFTYNSDESKKISFNGSYYTGGFWGGDRDRYQAGIQLNPTYKFQAEFNVTRNDVSLPEGAFIVDLIGTRINYSFSKRMFLNALIQYDSDNDEMLSNIRFNFMPKPLSDLYLVYNEKRDMDSNEVIDRAITLKLTWVFPL